MIKAYKLNKTFKIYKSPSERLKELIFSKKYHTEYVALNNISFEIKDGETLGLLGPNGAGKSTLLKILNGVIIPDGGSFQTEGKITGLLELGTGFNPEMTGIENIYMNGLFIGMAKEEINTKRDEIIDFAELGEFIDKPIKTYSSGMVMRLGFSIAIHAEPDCFLVDEALAVGDEYFQHKCFRKITEFRNNGGSIVLVSHDLQAIKTLCDSALLLDNGNVIDSGEPKEVTEFYHSMMLKKMHEGNNEVKFEKLRQIQKQSKRDLTQKHTFETKATSSTGDLEVISCRLYDDQNIEVNYIKTETVAKINFEILAHKDLEEPHFGFHIVTKMGVTIFETNTYCMGLKTSRIGKGELFNVTWEFECRLIPDTYTISIGIAQFGFDLASFKEYLLFINEVEILKVIPNSSSILCAGIYNVNPTVYIE